MEVPWEVQEISRTFQKIAWMAGGRVLPGAFPWAAPPFMPIGAATGL